MLNDLTRNDSLISPGDLFAGHVAGKDKFVRNVIHNCKMIMVTLVLIGKP